MGNRSFSAAPPVCSNSSRWVVERIDFDNGQHAAYHYAGTGALIGLASVDHADGTTTTVSGAVDALSQTLKISIFDAAADSTHRKKDAYVTLSVWVDPINMVLKSQAANRIRLVVNGSGEVAYLSLMNPSTKIYHYNGAKSLTRYTIYGNNPVSIAQAKTWQLGGNPDSFDWELDRSFTNDAKFRTISETDNLGRVTSFVRDPISGAITRTNFPDGTFETTTYNALTLPLVHTDRLGRVTECTYDARGNLLTKTTAVGTPEQAVYTWDYNAQGQVRHAYDALYDANFPDLHVTEFQYSSTGSPNNVDDSGYLVKIIQAADVAGGVRGVTTQTYDSAGRLVETVDPENRIVTTGYDVRNRVISVGYVDNTATQFVYGAGAEANLLVQKTDRTGRVTRLEYDAAGRVADTISGFGAAEAAHRTCTYVYGADLRAECVDRGNKTGFVYDYRNHLAATVSRPGTAAALTRSAEYVYNRLQVSADAYGRKTHYVYDANIRVRRTVRELVPGGAGTIPVSQTQRDAYLLARPRLATPNPAYVVTDNEYDAAGNTLASIDANGNRSEFVYDANTRLVEQKEAVGTAVEAKTQFVYDLQGNRTRVIHPRTFSEAPNVFYTDSTFNGRNLLATQTAAATTAIAATESFTYWPDGRQRDHTDARGNVTTSMWSHCCGYHRASADPAADNDNDGNTPPTRAAFVDRRDSENRLVHAYSVADWSPFPQDPAAPEAVYSNPPTTLNEATTRFDALSRPIARTVWLVQLGVVDKNDPPIAGDHGTNATDGLTTRWVYDDNLTDGVGLDATYAAQLTGLDLGINAVGSAVEVTNPAGEKTVTIHDGIGRTVRTLDGLQHATNYAYDIVINGLLETRVTDALSHVTKSRTDGAGRVRESEDQLGKISTFAYDNNGNTKSVRDANGVGHDCVYDARNRKVSCVDTHGDRTELNEFDAHNNLTKTTDALNHETTFSFDARDRKTQSVDRLAGATNFVYDANNNLTTLTDAQGGVTSYIFDPRNLLIVETYPDNGARSYVYDAARRLIKRVDQAGATTKYHYDSANRMVEREYPAPTPPDVFSFDSASRLITAASGQYNNSVNRTYDAASRITSETLTVGATPYNIGYGYDADNRQTQVIYPNGAIVDRTFTDRNQLESVAYNGVNAAILNYDNAGRLSTKTFGNGLVETRTYQADNLNATITTPGVTAFGYTWDANKRKLSQTETGIPINNQVYTYDNEDRLTGFSRNNGDNQTWNLSLVGDWNQFNNNGNIENRTHNAVHELTTVNAVPLVYDVKGNLTGNNNGQIYAWDIENRLTTAMDNQNNTLGIYTYDALGRRVSKTVGGNTTVFVSDGMQKICGYENGTLARAYAYGSYIDEPLVMVSGVNKYYYHSNNLYSVAALTDAAGAVIERYKYDPYGKATILAADGATTRTASIVNNPFMYDGYYHDTETGLEFVNARYYSSDLGRFIARDPIGYRGGIDLYEYVKSKPTNFVDPSGCKIRVLVVDCTIYAHLFITLYARWKDLQLSQDEINAVAVRVEKSIEKHWNNGHSYFDGCHVEFKAKVDAQYIRQSDGRPPGDNVIKLRNQSPNFVDFVRNGHNGEWNRQSDDWVYAHEAGHLMGLADTYDSNWYNIFASRKTWPLAGHEGEMMAEVDGEVSEQEMQAVMKINNIKCSCKCREIPASRSSKYGPTLVP
jgi:RHS repeat-associated protein